jgi:hypothetical protein
MDSSTSSKYTSMGPCGSKPAATPAEAAPVTEVTCSRGSSLSDGIYTASTTQRFVVSANRVSPLTPDLLHDDRMYKKSTSHWPPETCSQYSQPIQPRALWRRICEHHLLRMLPPLRHRASSLTSLLAFDVSAWQKPFPLTGRTLLVTVADLSAIGFDCLRTCLTPFFGFDVVIGI